MNTLTPIPDAYSYGIILLILYAVSGSSLAAHITSRWKAAARIGLLPIYALVLVATAVWGIMLVSSPGSNVPALLHAVSVLIGVPAGIVASSLDRRIARRFSHAATGKGFRSAEHMRRRITVQTVEKKGFPMSARAAQTVWSSPAAHQLALMLIAVLEEVVFRGFLLSLALQQESIALRWTLVSAQIAFFCLLHVWYGWPNVLAKAPLAIVTTGLTIATNSLFGAIATHLVFNRLAWLGSHDPLLPSRHRPS